MLLGLTGTLIQNSLEELWTVADILYPGYLGTIDAFRQKFDTPIKTGQRHDATASQIAKGRIAAQQLAQQLQILVLRRTKATVGAQIPAKEDNIIFCKLSEYQFRSYRRLLQSEVYTNLRQHRDTNGGNFLDDSDNGMNGELAKMVFPAIIRLQKLSNHLGLLLPSSKQEVNYRNLEFLNLCLLL